MEIRSRVDQLLVGGQLTSFGFGLWSGQDPVPLIKHLNQGLPGRTLAVLKIQFRNHNGAVDVDADTAGTWFLVTGGMGDADDLISFKLRMMTCYEAH